MDDLDGCAAETVREMAPPYAAKAMLLIEALGVDRRLESDWAAMAQSCLGDSDIEQPPAESGSSNFGQYEQSSHLARFGVDKSDHRALANAHRHSSPGDELFIESRGALTHPILDLGPGIGGACKAADRGPGDVENRLRVFATRGSERKMTVACHEERPCVVHSGLRTAMISSS